MNISDIRPFLSKRNEFLLLFASLNILALILIITSILNKSFDLAHEAVLAQDPIVQKNLVSLANSLAESTLKGKLIWALVINGGLSLGIGLVDTWFSFQGPRKRENLSLMLLQLKVEEQKHKTRLLRKQSKTFGKQR